MVLQPLNLILFARCGSEYDEREWLIVQRVTELRDVWRYYSPLPQNLQNLDCLQIESKGSVVVAQSA